MHEVRQLRKYERVLVNLLHDQQHTIFARQLPLAKAELVDWMLTTFGMPGTVISGATRS
jgi:hypothetical protein